MEQNNKVNQTGEGDNNAEEFIDEKTKNKIDRHLHDINDTISADDIKNIIIPGETNISEDQPTINKESGDKDENKEPSPTSWNILE